MFKRYFRAATALCILAFAMPGMTSAKSAYSGRDAQMIECASNRSTTVVAAQIFGQMSEEQMARFLAETEFALASHLDITPGAASGLIEARVRQNRERGVGPLEMMREANRTKAWCGRNFFGL